jgi:hypothetical protein
MAMRTPTKPWNGCDHQDRDDWVRSSGWDGSSTQSSTRLISRTGPSPRPTSLRNDARVSSGLLRRQSTDRTAATRRESCGIAVTMHGLIGSEEVVGSTCSSDRARWNRSTSIIKRSTVSSLLNEPVDRWRWFVLVVHRSHDVRPVAESRQRRSSREYGVETSKFR